MADVGILLKCLLGVEYTFMFLSCIIDSPKQRSVFLLLHLSSLMFFPFGSVLAQLLFASRQMSKEYLRKREQAHFPCSNSSNLSGLLLFKNEC